MAFTPTSMHLFAHGATFNMWHYGPTADAGATIAASGYFNQWANQMQVGDWIFVSGVATANLIYIVAGITVAGVVTVAAGPT